MCLNPSTLEGGVVVGCRICWQCKLRKVDDLVGRCIAESRTASHTFSVTLTYGREGGESDTIRAAVLTYSDVQKYIKRLRFAGYKVRYLVAGEFGTLRGRCHWHLILFFEGSPPPHVLNKRFGHQLADIGTSHARSGAGRHLVLSDSKAGAGVVDFDLWPHGFSFWEGVSYKSVRYVAKYIGKDMGDENGQSHSGMSRMPPLGAVYFAQLADKMAKAGLPMKTPVYSFPDVRGRMGGKKEFVFQGRSRELFIEQYQAAWERYHGERPWVHDPFHVEEISAVYRKQWHYEADGSIDWEHPLNQRLPEIAPLRKLIGEHARPHDWWPFRTKSGTVLTVYGPEAECYIWRPDKKGSGIWRASRIVRTGPKEWDYRIEVR